MLLFECLNTSEIAVHVCAKRIASFMYYAGDNLDRKTIGRNLGCRALSSEVFFGNIIGSGTALTNLNYIAIPFTPGLSIYATHKNSSYLNTISINSFF
jgi:hypothetical protein